jgi:predicted HicB family RNase H-like nuclease
MLISILFIVLDPTIAIFIFYLLVYVINYNIYFNSSSIYNYVEVMKMAQKLKIQKKNLKGEDGYKTFSIRVKDETVEKLNQLAVQTNRSRNDLINVLLDYAIEHSEVE